MAENRRVRIETHIEAYLLTHAERVLHKPSNQVTSQDFNTLVNSLIYEHKLALEVVQKIKIGSLADWLCSLIPAVSKLSFIPQGKQAQPPISAQEPEDFSFDAQLGDLYEEEAA